MRLGTERSGLPRTVLGKMGSDRKLLLISEGRANKTGFNKLDSKHWQHIQVEIISVQLFILKPRQGIASLTKAKASGAAGRGQPASRSRSLH